MRYLAVYETIYPLNSNNFPFLLLFACDGTITKVVSSELPPKVWT
jgi:hypothetical protein